MGTLQHMIWTCPHLSFWNMVFRLISGKTSHIIKLTLKMVILSMDVECFSLLLRTIVMHILFAARLTILVVIIHVDASYPSKQNMAYIQCWVNIKKSMTAGIFG